MATHYDRALNTEYAGRNTNGCFATLLLIVAMTIASCTAFFDFNTPSLIVKPNNNVVEIDFNGGNISIAKSEKAFFSITGKVDIRLTSGTIDTVMQVELTPSVIRVIEFQNTKFELK